jgi:hypothetical protein
MVAPGAQLKLSVGVVRYDVAKLRIVQSLVPFAVLATIAARHLESSAGYLLAFALQLAIVVVFLNARRGYGQQTLVHDGAGLRLVESAETLSRRNTPRWTVVNRTARLYGSRWSYKLRVDAAHKDDLASLVHAGLGAPIVLRRRGTPRARMGALCAAIGGAIAVACAFAFDSVALVVVGALAMTSGLIALGVLSQRIRDWRASPSV